MMETVKAVGPHEHNWIERAADERPQDPRHLAAHERKGRQPDDKQQFDRAAGTDNPAQTGQQSRIAPETGHCEDRDVGHQ